MHDLRKHWQASYSASFFTSPSVTVFPSSSGYDLYGADGVSPFFHKQHWACWKGGRCICARHWVLRTTFSCLPWCRSQSYLVLSSWVNAVWCQGCSDPNERSSAITLTPREVLQRKLCCGVTHISWSSLCILVCVPEPRRGRRDGATQKEEVPLLAQFLP